MNVPHPNTSPFTRPYIISWNLTYRCNLACEHCYLDAGGAPLVRTENFADRSELGTDECFRVIDEIAAFAPECMTILTGGEPLLRRDILEIVRRVPGGYALLWGYGRMGMSRPAHTSRSSPETFAGRLSRTSGRHRRCSPTFAAAPRSRDGAGPAR